MLAIGSAIRDGLVLACHDLSEGGLAVAAAEMSLAGLLGVALDLRMIPCEPLECEPDDRRTVLLFSETASRFLLEVAPGQREAFEQFMRVHGVQEFASIGYVTGNGRFVIRDGEAVVIDVSVDELQAAWKGERA